MTIHYWITRHSEKTRSSEPLEEEYRALDLALKVARLREKRHLSQKELADLMGTSQQAISRIESGEYEGFSFKTLKKIAEATGTRLKIDFVPAR